MHAHLTSFWFQKPSLRPEEFEDAFFPRAPGELVGRHLRFAVADGATEGVGSAAWAQILAKTFGRCAGAILNETQLLQRAHRDWALYKERQLLEPWSGLGGVPCFVEEGLRVGAFSTLLGLRLSDKGEGSEGQWEALAVGDSCLAQVRDDELLRLFPLEVACDFDNRPLLIGSNPAYNRALAGAIKTCLGEWRTDDAIYLMTDALAAWFVRQHEARKAPWRILRDLDTSDQAQPFADWIRGLQSRGEMRKDDVTLLRIDVH
jgi:hypothetical protein